MWRFEDPLWLTALALLPVWIFALNRSSTPGIRFPALGGFPESGRDLWSQRHRIPSWLRLLSLILMILALARPQEGQEQARVNTEGIDIVLAVDISTSMLAEDFRDDDGNRQNRLEAVKDVVEEFVENRPNDRIGLVVFAGLPYVQAPLTLDHDWLLTQLKQVEIGLIEDGTAVGSAIGASLNRLRESEAKSRIVVLLTDGVSNAGDLDPKAAAELADTLGIKVYTVAAGTNGLAPFPATDFFGRKVYRQARTEVDEETLRMVARMTQAEFFRAEDREGLKKTYAQIDKLETTTYDEPAFTVSKEFYPVLIGLVFLLLFVERWLAETYLRVLP